MPKTSDMINSKFLRKEDLQDPVVCTITGVSLEDMPGDKGEQRWVLNFRELKKGLVLNVTKIRVLEAAYGDDSDLWVGKRVKLDVDPQVTFGGKVVGGLRLRTPPPPKAPAPAPAPQPKPVEQRTLSDHAAPAADEFDDDIPF